MGCITQNLVERSLDFRMSAALISVFLLMDKSNEGFFDIHISKILKALRFLVTIWLSPASGKILVKEFTHKNPSLFLSETAPVLVPIIEIEISANLHCVVKKKPKS